MPRIFSILLFITCIYYLGRIPSSILTNKLKGTERTKKEQEGSTEKDTSPSLFSEEKEDPDKIDKTEEILRNSPGPTLETIRSFFKSLGP